jgi:RNA polymerase sigma-70 factor (ECF subfamily)
MEYQPHRHWEAFVKKPGEATFEPFYESTKRLVFTICMRILRDPEDAADAMQMTYARLLAEARAAGPGAEAPDPRRWLYRLTLREAQNLRARRRRHQHREIAVEDLTLIARDNRQAGEEMERSRLSEQLGALLERLPEDLQTALTLHYYLGQKQSEIAETLGVSKMTISRRIRLGLRRLERLARKAGLGAEAAAMLPPAGSLLLLDPPSALSATEVFAGLPEVGAVGLTGLGGAAGGFWGLASGLNLKAAALALLGLIGLGAGWIALLQWGAGPVTDWSGWRSAVVSGNPVFHRDRLGLGIEVPPGGATIGDWVSPDRLIALEPNAVYQIRLYVDSDQSEARRTPMWGLLLHNYSWDGAYGENAFGGEAYFMAQLGDTNAAGVHPWRRWRTFEYWFTPPAALTPQWQDPAGGAFAGENAGKGDIQLGFRVLDVDAANYGAEQDWGRVTLRGLEILRHDLRDMIEEAVVYDAENLTGDGVRPTHHVESLANQTTYTFTAGELLIAPRDETGWGDELVRVNVGDRIANIDLAEGLEDNWPIAWESHQLYLIEADLSTPDEIGERNPPDRIRLGMDSATQELAVMSTQTPQMRGAGTPRRGAPQRYITFFHGNRATVAGPAALRRLRPRLDLVANLDHGFYAWPTNRGAVVLHGMRVKRVRFPEEKAVKVFPMDGGEGSVAGN